MFFFFVPDHVAIVGTKSLFRRRCQFQFPSFPIVVAGVVWPHSGWCHQSTKQNRHLQGSLVTNEEHETIFFEEWTRANPLQGEFKSCVSRKCCYITLNKIIKSWNVNLCWKSGITHNNSSRYKFYYVKFSRFFNCVRLSVNFNVLQCVFELVRVRFLDN